MRVVIADDSVIVREGIATILTRAGIEVAAQASDPDELLREVDAHRPDVAIVDIRMPPTHTDEGLQAAQAVRARHPDMGIVIVSEHVEVGVATQALAASPERLGYVLKQRITDIDDFVGTLRRVIAGGSALDPQVVSGLLAAQRDDGPLEALTPREREVLELMAEGRSNAGIARRLWVTEGTVEKHVQSILGKLGLRATDEEDHRRVLAVITYLDAR